MSAPGTELLAGDKPVDIGEARKRHPDCVVIRLRYRVPSPLWPRGFECLLAIPRAKYEEARASGPLFHQEGEIIEVRGGVEHRGESGPWRAGWPGKLDGEVIATAFTYMETVEQTAQRIAGLPSVKERRAELDKTPFRSEVAERVQQLWAERETEQANAEAVAA